MGNFHLFGFEVHEMFQIVSLYICFVFRVAKVTLKSIYKNWIFVLNQVRYN